MAITSGYVADCCSATGFDVSVAASSPEIELMPRPSATVGDEVDPIVVVGAVVTFVEAGNCTVATLSSRLTSGAFVRAVLYQIPVASRSVVARSPSNQTTCKRLPWPTTILGYSGNCGAETMRDGFDDQCEPSHSLWRRPMAVESSE